MELVLVRKCVWMGDKIDKKIDGMMFYMKKKNEKQ